jgi:hypothetical protein
MSPNSTAFQPHVIEQELLQTTECYETALQQLTAMNVDVSDPARVLEVTSRLSRILDSIQNPQHASIQEIVTQFQAAGISPQPAVGGLIDRAKCAMKELLARIDELSQAASESRDRLAPQVDETVQEHRAASAYGRYGS